MRPGSCGELQSKLRTKSNGSWNPAMLELEVAACTVFRARECTLYLHTIESYYFTPGRHFGRDKTIPKKLRADSIGRT